MIKCPYCAEEIQSEAIKCRYCNEFLNKPHGFKTNTQKTKWYYSYSIMIFALLSVGPFALPLVWINPNLRQITKILLSIATIIFSIWFYFIISDLYKNLIDNMNTLDLYQ